MLAAAALALSGCVVERMAALKGHPVAEMEQRFGPPAKVADITADQRIYTWTRRVDLKSAPPPVSVFQPTAGGHFYRVQHQYAKGMYCEFRVLVRHRSSDGIWVVNRVYDPGIRCE